MAAGKDSKNQTKVERKSDRELVVTRSFDAPARIVFQAWTKPELMKRWWMPKSVGVNMLSCEMDVRTGGGYRFSFGEDPSKAVVFFGKYIEVIPGSRMVWSNEEDPDGPVTTVTFQEKGGKTLMTFHELFPSKQALDQSLGGMYEAMPEMFTQLDELLVSLQK